VYQRELWEQESQRTLELVREAGVAVSYPDKQPFVDRVAKMHEAYADKPAGPYLRRILEAE
jgi:TRAP-type C4-dicarboxylate transport system substrate-binding protein